MPSFKQDLITLLHQHKNTGEYVNPYIIVGVVNAIEDVYGEDNLDELYDWANDMYER